MLELMRKEGNSRCDGAVNTFLCHFGIVSRTKYVPMDYFWNTENCGSDYPNKNYFKYDVKKVRICRWS